ncbi:SDR family oxidoreductase [soil metagenome]
MDEAFLEDKLAVVTGGGRGIGRAIAIGLARAGAEVVVVARSREQLDVTVRLVRDSGGTASMVVADLGDPDGLERAIGTLHDLGRTDVLINNAATVAPLGPTVSLDASSMTAALGLNVVAPAILSARLLPAMIDKRWGRIVNVSSGIVGRPTTMIGGNVYAVSKAALETHTVNLAAELEGTGVTVNAFRPGAVDTAMQEWIRAQSPEKIGSSLHERFTRTFAEGRLVSPDVSASSLIARLGTDATGQIWDITD